MFFFIPGLLITLVTFPGVIMHEIAHRFFCDITKTPVYAINYFNYVIHRPANEIKKSLLISVGPLIINTLLCMIITFAAMFPKVAFDQRESSILSYFLLWVGFSIGAHAFPSNVDIKSFVSQVQQKQKVGILLSFILSVTVIFFKIINILRIVWFDFIYAILISAILPILFIKYLI